MENINPSRRQGTKMIGTLASQDIEKIAAKHEFRIRNGGKISASILLESFILMMQAGVSSYWHWAVSISSLTGTLVSKQAVFKRMEPAWTATVKALVALVVSAQGGINQSEAVFKSFGAVWLQDSSSFHLPDILSEKFKGNVSRGKQKSIAKLNLVVNLMTGLCPVMRLDSFTVNEQRLSDSILSIARSGDLVIRDLGYFVLDVFSKLTEARIFYLSRLKHGVFLFSITGESLCLPKLLSGKTMLDMWVLCGSKERLAVRLVAIKLDEQQTAERIRKAKNDRDKRLNHSDNYYFLLGYVIFITNVGKDTWQAEQVAQAYRCRWNVEILFKSWKSGLHACRLIPLARVHTDRVESYLYMMMLYLSWFHLMIFAPLRWAVYRDTGRHLSIIKAALWAANNINWFFTGCSQKIEREIKHYCLYDKRKGRQNAMEKLDAFLQLTLG
jgi:hypothetical protein